MTAPDRAARLGEIRGRWGDALEDKWCFGESTPDPELYTQTVYDQCGNPVADVLLQEDADAIAHAPEDITYLLGEVERLSRMEPPEQDAECVRAVDIEWMGEGCAFRCRCGHAPTLTAYPDESVTCPSCGRLFTYHMDAWLGVIESAARAAMEERG